MSNLKIVPVVLVAIYLNYLITIVDFKAVAIDENAI